METACKWSGIQPQRGCSGRATAERPGTAVQQVAWHAATWMNALYINARHLSNQLDLASVTEACLMSLSSTEYAFVLIHRGYIWLCLIAPCCLSQLSCAMIRRLPQKRVQTGDEDASSFRFSSGNLKHFWLISPKAFLLAVLAWLGGRSSCRASVSARLQSVNALRSDPSQLYVSSCPNLDWVRLISVDRVKEKANSSAQTFVSDRR